MSTLTHAPQGATGDRPGSVVTIDAVAWDDPAAVALRAEAVADLGRRYGGDEDAKEVVDPASIVVTVLVRVDGVVAGCGSVRDVSGTDDLRGRGTTHPAATGEVKRVYVDPAYRGRGLARRLMGDLERSVRRVGFRRLVLETGTAQPEAMTLYAALGFEPIESYGTFAGEAEQRCYGKRL